VDASLPTHADRAGSVRHAHLASYWVTAREAFWIALDALRAHKLRSFLTLLGVVIATTTLISVMSIVNGMNLYISERIANLGANVFIVHQYQWAQGYEAWLRARRRNQPMRLEEYEFLKENLTGAKNIGASSRLFGQSDARYGGRTLEEVDLYGNTPSSIDIGQEKVALGRYFTESDHQRSAMVCFIGTDLLDEFFANVDPIGKEITVRGIPFNVIGVADKIGTTFGESQDKFVHIPLTTFQKVFMARPQLAISVQAWNADHMRVLEDQTRALMRARRHTPYAEEDTFGINASDTLMSAWHKLTGSIFAVTIGVVAVFMVVGGIVIMNIMLASVTERTHEIGILLAVGWKRLRIVFMVLCESALLGFFGGVAGVIIGILGLKVLEQTAVRGMLQPDTSPMLLMTSIGIAVLVGVLSGLYPAWRSSLLSPAVALHAE